MEKENWLLEETLLHEKYQIKKVLGQGGFGITYLAYDQTLQQNVAIKEYFPVKIVRRLGNTLREGQGEYELSATAMVYPQNGQEEKYLNGMKNFLEEAQVLFGKFDVEGLAAVKDYFEENGTVYIVMEYLSGPTLQETTSSSRASPGRASLCSTRCMFGCWARPTRPAKWRRSPTTWVSP